MKPERAKKKFCPFGIAGPAGNPRCWAGDCMAWEWIDEDGTLGFCILIEGKDKTE